MAQEIERGAVPPSDAVSQPQIKQALAAWERARLAAREADREMLKLERGTGRAQAEHADAEQLAVALEHGKPAPKPTRAAQFEQQLADARRQARATALVEQRRWADAQAAFAEHIGELREHTDKEFELRRGAYVSAIDAVEQAHAQMADLIAMRVFLAEDGPGAGAFHAAGWASTITAPAANALDDSQVAVSDVLAELRDVGGPPKPRAGLNPQALQSPESGQQAHIPPWAQGRTRAISPPGFERVPG